MGDCGGTTGQPLSRTFPKTFQDEAIVEWIDDTIAVLVGGVTVGIAGAHWTSEPGQDESTVHWIDRPVTIGVAVAIIWRTAYGIEDVCRAGVSPIVVVPTGPDNRRVAADACGGAEVVKSRTVACGDLGDLAPIIDPTLVSLVHLRRAGVRPIVVVSRGPHAYRDAAAVNGGPEGVGNAAVTRDDLGHLAPIVNAAFVSLVHVRRAVV